HVAEASRYVVDDLNARRGVQCGRLVQVIEGVRERGSGRNTQGARRAVRNTVLGLRDREIRATVRRRRLEYPEVAERQIAPRAGTERQALSSDRVRAGEQTTREVHAGARAGSRVSRNSDRE